MTVQNCSINASCSEVFIVCIVSDRAQAQPGTFRQGHQGWPFLVFQESIVVITIHDSLKSFLHCIEDKTPTTHSEPRKTNLIHGNSANHNDLTARTLAQQRANLIHQGAHQRRVRALRVHAVCAVHGLHKNAHVARSNRPIQRCACSNTLDNFTLDDAKNKNNCI